MRILLTVAVSLVLVVGLIALLVLRSTAVQEAIFDRAVERRVAAAPEELFGDDALRVLLCGTSSPLPHPTRAKPCTAVFAGGRFFVVDTGLGSWNRLAGWRIPGDRIGGVLLTHFHSDHIGALGEFDLQTWVAGREEPLRVFGPPGVERVVAGFEEAYDLDAGYRIAHHGEEVLSESRGRMQAHRFETGAPGQPPVVVLEEDGLRVTAFPVPHPPIVPAVGYRFDYAGRSIFVSGDTERSQEVVRAAEAVDVLVHEAQANHLVAKLEAQLTRIGRPRLAKIMSDIPDYHTTPVEAAEVANEAGVGLLLMTHLTPPPPLALFEPLYTVGVDEVRPEGWILGDDGLLVELPRDSRAIETRWLR